jgi:hypothetical protein
MDSKLTILFEKYSNKIINYLDNNNIKIKHYNITTFSIILNASALINLLYKEFIIFVLLFFSSYNLNIFYEQFIKKYNTETQITAYYNRFGQWLILFTTLMIFVSIYNTNISQNILLIFILLSILYLIHYILDITITNYNISNSSNNDLKYKISKYIAKNNITKNNLEQITNITKYFDKTMIIIYIILLMTYIHYKTL